MNASKVDFDQEELGAMEVLADVGLVPRLRLVTDEQGLATGQSLPARDNDADRRAM